VSGLSVASLRLQVAARNIANASSGGPLPGTPNPENFPSAYSALRVNQVDNLGGGTSATMTNVLPPTVATYDPTAPYADGRGMVASPNVDLANELVQMLVARFTYAANAQVIRADAQMSVALFNITA
jgi:flagellar basal-body rod protein FlgC